MIAGQTQTLVSTWHAFEGGPAADLTGTTIAIKTVDGVTTVLAATSVGVNHPATGVYTYAWASSVTLTAGDYLVIWAGVDDQGDAVTATEIITVQSPVTGSGGPDEGAWYCTAEDVKTALDIKPGARADAAVARAVAGATDSVQGLCHRTFVPWQGTRYFDFPDASSYSVPWVLRLGEHEVVSVSQLVAGGTTIDADDYSLEPNGDGAPYSRIEIQLDSAAALAAGPTSQRAVAVTGVWAGCRVTMDPVATLAEALDATETGVDVSDSAAIGTGDLLQVDSEWMVVTARRMLDTGVNIDAADSLTADKADVAITVSTLTGAPTVDETILIGSERMLVVDVAGSVLTVQRAVNGTVLAVHAGSADIYAPRTLTVRRGAQGTTAATHTTAATVSRQVKPGLVRSLAVGEATAIMLQEPTGWARTAGSGDSEREVSGKSLVRLREQTYDRYGRGGRKWAV